MSRTENTSDRRLLRQDVTKTLLKYILDGTLEPGQHIRNDELSESLGVSRTPVREALNHLAYLGLIDTSPNRYTRVTPLDPRYLHETLVILQEMLPMIMGSMLVDRSSVGSSLDFLELQLKNNRIEPWEATEAMISQIGLSITNTALRDVASRLLIHLHRFLLLNPEIASEILQPQLLADAMNAFQAEDRSELLRLSLRLTDSLNTALEQRFESSST